MGPVERRGRRLPSSSSRSWFPHAMQSHIWKKALGGAFYHLLAMAGGEPGAVWTGKVTERPPEEVHLLRSLESAGRGWISRKRPDQHSENHSTSELSCCLESLP